MPAFSPITPRSVWVGLDGTHGQNESLTRLRELLVAEFGCADLVLMDSGTSALGLAIRGALALTESSVVALPGYCCFDVATAAVAADARAALYDVLPETLGPDFESLKVALDEGARVIVVAHLYGIPVDVDRCRDLAAEYDAILIEDAAQGAGGSWRGKPLGGLGDVGILSFGRGKGRTGGGGGAVLANGDRGSAVLDQIRNSPAPAHGGSGAIARLLAQWALGRPSLYGIPASLPFLGLGETRYKEPWEPRWMGSGLSASLQANWEASERESERRRQRDEWLSAQLGDVPGLIVPRAPEGGVAGGLRFPVVIGPVTDSKAILRASRAGIVRGYPTSLSELPVIVDRQATRVVVSGASRLAESLWTLPTHSRSSRTDTTRALAALTQYSVAANSA